MDPESVLVGAILGATVTVLAAIGFLEWANRSARGGTR